MVSGALNAPSNVESLVEQGVLSLVVCNGIVSGRHEKHFPMPHNPIICELYKNNWKFEQEETL